MHTPLRLDALLGLVRSGLWAGQVLAAVVLLLVVILGDLSLVTWVTDRIRLTTVFLAGGALVCCAALRLLVSSLLLTIRGAPDTGRGRASIGIRLVEVFLTCAAVGLVGLAVFDSSVTGDFDSFTVAVGTSEFGVLVLVLATLVVANAVGSTLLVTVRRAD